jgi:hypothetical protein
VALHFESREHHLKALQKAQLHRRLDALNNRRLDKDFIWPGVLV